MLREQAFTVLNRFAALRMAEERGIIVESVGAGLNSKAFKTFSEVAYSGLGTAYQRYRTFLGCLCDEMAVDLGMLFDLRSPYGLLFPRENVLLELFELLNAPELKPLWKEDETIGWIYQYFNDPAERKKMREESAAPRNSRELAVRNQFFTPRYVVEFLTDNTLGRIWYEMTQGKTKLKEQCRYLVRRPTEVFLKTGEKAPEQPKQDNLSQGELLKQPVHIPHRPLKDPRTILMLDPACGSMHFGLYAFDLFEVIYEEAWELEKRGEQFQPRSPGMLSLRETYGTKEDFLKDVPRLIIEHNLHGIDIDPRCAQIAGLSLWLRAQKAWQLLGLRPTARPAIKRSNIVCAEPMPGDKELLREFVQKEFPVEERGVVLRLLEIIFDKMQLAGEAGSLLKIEEEIRSAIAGAKQLWEAGPKLEQSALFVEPARLKQEEIELDLSGITDEQFWERIEEQIYAALRDYAEQAENGGGFQRRLFAEDAARGFAFIDVCRKRYDVAAMNPPFGEHSRQAENYAFKAYPDAKNDIYGCFLHIAIQRRSARGLVGAITSRTWMFLPRRQAIRLEVVSSHALVLCLADFGHGVLDGAMVETCAFVLDQPQPSRHSTFLRLVDVALDKKPSVLAETISAGAHSRRYDVLQNKFELLPGSPFAYWISESLFDLLSKGERFGDAWDIGPGLTTRDNDRFARSPTEIPRNTLGKTWFWFAKGGSFSPYYFDTELVLNYADDGAELKAWIASLGESVTTFVANQKFYFRCGFTYPTITDKGFNVRVLREGHIFSNKGISIFPKHRAGSLLAALAYLNSGLVQELLLLMAPSRSWEKTFVASLPALRCNPHLLEERAKTIVKRLLESLSKDISSNLFLSLPFAGSLKVTFSALQVQQDTHSEEVRSAAGDVSLHVREALGCVVPSGGDDFAGDAWEAAHVFEDTLSYAAALADYSLGCVFGRWDVRYATAERAAPELTDPFGSLPVCPPGQLQNPQGLPAGSGDVPASYPIRIPWDGIVVDDPNHPLDIERRVRKVIEIIWAGRAGGPTAEAIEHEACEILGVKSLREYFCKPSGFFADHLKRYSKSRRQAPVYWPLSTASGSYTLWIYYHRLTDQTLFQCVNDFVKPKIAEVDGDLSRVQKAEGREQRAKLERLMALRAELVEFQDELLRVAGLPYKPNLNDGVLITASPLWKLFRLPKWQKDLKACWESLEAGEFDWAHLAYTIWPERVKKVCKTDRSIAIAHGLEELCEVKAPEKKMKKDKRNATEATLEL